MPGDDFALDDAQAERRRCDRWAMFALAACVALLVHLAWVTGPTYDEHFYIASGYAYWHDADFGLNREHPPLLKLLAGFPLLFAPGVELPEHWRELMAYPSTFLYQQNAAALDRNLFLARLPLVALTALGALLVYTTARRLWSPRAGLVSLLLFAFNPNVLAHGPLAALDMGIAVLLFASVKWQVALLERPSWERAFWAALLFGAANLAKSTGLLLVPVYGGLALVAALRARSVKPLGWTLASAFGGLAIFAAGYGFEARSIWDVWGDAQYRTDLRRPGLYADPAAIAGAVRETGLDAALLEQVTRAPNAVASVDRLVVAALHGTSEQRRQSLRALARLVEALEPARKRAFEQLLYQPAAPEDASARLDALSGLAGVELPNLDVARRHWENEQGEAWGRAIFSRAWIDRPVRAVFGDRAPIPLLSALKGIDYQLHHGSFGHSIVFRGRVLQAGADFEHGNPVPEFFAWVMAIKNPLVALALFAVGLALCARQHAQWTLLRALALVGTPLLLFLVFSRGSALLGVRYVLPIFPFLCVLAARSALYFPRAALALALVAAAEGVWVHPHELMYYNAAAGGPERGPRISVVGDDWGQEVRELGRVVAKNRAWIEQAGGLYYDPYSVADLAAFGLEGSKPLHGPVRGIVAAHAITYYREPKEYGWLAEFKPFAKIGWSIWLYDTRPGPPGGEKPAEWRE
ncbi:MAG: phospholipid carrier-dependent glycosyltransferase [Planctomycetota bacterium]|nr:MAG: phospholipid carrier-dependent glycosyltransferase [Planctomycetota bacterium]